jgi:hypothetical protein
VLNAFFKSDLMTKHKHKITKLAFSYPVIIIIIIILFHYHKGLSAIGLDLPIASLDLQSQLVLCMFLCPIGVSSVQSHREEHLIRSRKERGGTGW